MEKSKMDNAVYVPVLRSPPQRQLEVSQGGELSGQRPTMHPEGSCTTTEVLYITSAEQKLWGQLMGVLSPTLWEVKASVRLQGESGVISLLGSREVVSRAKEAISKLLILMGSMAKTNQMVLPQTEQRAAGFFHLSKGLNLFLWEGEASRFRVDAIVSISLKEDIGCGDAVFVQRVPNQNGSPCIHFSIFLSWPQMVELGAGAVKLVLEAASQKGLQSLLLSFTDPFPSTYQAEALALGIEAFKKDCPTSPLKTIHFVSSDRDAVAAFCKACEERWPIGTSYRDQLRNMLLSLERVKTEVVSGYNTKQKTDVAVVPLVLESDGMGWHPQSLATTQKALKIVPQAINLQPEEILSVSSSAFPEFACGELYMVCLKGSQLRPEGTLEQAVRKMVWSCLSAFYGSFLESISFPFLEPADPGLAGKGEWLLIMLEEIDRFLKEFPNTWMKLVQIVHLLEQSPLCQGEDRITTAVGYKYGLMLNKLAFLSELVGVCHSEDPLFLQYLKESPDAFQQFEMQLKEIGCGIQMFSSWGILMLSAMSPSVELYDLGTAFQSMREKYMMHCETRRDVIEALLEELTLVNEFKSIRIFFRDRIWFVGLCDETASFLHCLFRVAFQRQVVSLECSAEPLCRATIAKDILNQEILKSGTLVTLEMVTKSPPIIRFGGRRHRAEEAERRFKELLSGFQVLPVPLSNFQSHFVKAQWGNLFHNNFFLEQGLPSVLEISEVVQVAGLDLGEMKKAETLFLKHVCERTVEIAEEVKWATMSEDWKKLLRRLGSHKEIALHEMLSTQVTIVGICPHVTRVQQAIQEYLWDNSPMEERISFDRPELVTAQQNLLRITSWEHLNVSIQVLPDSQILDLQVSGIRKSVQKAIPVITKYLDSLVLGKMPMRKKSLRKYFFRSGAAVLKEIALQRHCMVTMRMQDTVECSGRATNSHGDEHGQEGLVKNRLWVIEALGREDHVALLKRDMVSFMAKFRERNIHSEAIATFSDQFLKELCSSTSHSFPIDLCHVKDDELQVCGIQEDVENILEAIRAKIEEYQAEQIEVVARYEKVSCVFVEEFLVHEMLPSNPPASSEILAGNPATVIFRGPRQNVVELEKRFKEVLGGFQVLPVSLSDLQSQFVKAQWGSLFHKNFFLEQGIAALLEVSGAIQVSGLDLGTIKKAEELIVKHVCEKTMEIPEEVKWATECEDWRKLLRKLESHQEVALHHNSSSLLFLVGICPCITQVEQSVKDFLKDHSQVEERLNVTRPELALVGENLFLIMDWDHLEVNVQVQPDSQILSLKVSGIQKHVREAKSTIKTDLDSLVLEKLPLKKVALGEYFSGAGADTLHDMAQEQHCVARLEMQRSPGCCDGVTNTNGNEKQGVAELSCAVVHVVGKQSDVTSFKRDAADFLAKFHEEIVCSAELPAFSDEALGDLCKNTPHQFPVAVCHLREKVVRVCGSREDVVKVLGAIYAKIEEATHVKIERDHQDWLEAKLLRETIQWHRMTDAGWSAFDMVTNHRLEKAYRKQEVKAQLQWEGQEIRINLLKNEAFVPSRGAKFKLRREICLWDKNIAPHWEAMDQCLVKKVELQRSSEEYQDVVKKFNQTGGGFKILKVERIQNRYLWVSYCWKRSWMDKKNPEGVQNERILYHGTRPENWHSIQEIGFKSACRKVGLYGQGIYFAKEAVRSAYYAKPDSGGQRFMFQTRVLIGEYTRGGEKMVLPPMKPGGKGRYDSLVDVLSKPAIFVTFFDDHAYPEYLITFCGSPP
ncbi:uncharacterized protein LOC132583277 [Heteronotia binoei]|uniref:uncharacterized protein LOC132583277 n=1 Tax=Heteronotia binoei TaxID=13085 RepID=UPI00292D5EA8|nr:uncharacterized protein LOC132583277 [Heteronotia binoei]